MTGEWWFGNIKRDHLRALLLRECAADEGPWKFAGPSKEDWAHGENSLTNAHESIVSGWGYDASGLDCDPHNADFIAHSREDIPALIRLVQSLAGELARDERTPRAKEEAAQLLAVLNTKRRIVAVEEPS